MADKTPERPSSDELRQLPLKAIVAYAVRAARRVQPICVKSWWDNPEKQRDLIQKVDRALSLAANFSSGKNVAADEINAAAYAANAAAYAANAANAANAPNAPNDAVYAADAAAAANAAANANDVNAALRSDFDLLLKRHEEKPERSNAVFQPASEDSSASCGQTIRLTGTRNSNHSSMPSSKAKTSIL